MAAKRGNATAQYNLGYYYDQGIRGLQQSSKRAIELYTLAAEQGHADAQFNLGFLYANGEVLKHRFQKQENCGQKQQHKETKMLLKVLND
jgi:TPR repeat protein